MSIMFDATKAEFRPHFERTGPGPVIDILIVFTVMLSAYLLEGFAASQGWISVGAGARGVSGVVCAALAAIIVVLVRGKTLADLGIKRPRRWRLVPIQVLGVLFVFIAAQYLVPLLLSAFFAVPEPDFSRYEGISGNLGGAIAMALILPLTASIPEEIIYRGFLIGRLSNIFGHDGGGAVISVLVQALIFSAVHFQWGVGGMILALVMGLVWGTAYLLCDRNLWVVILAHSAGHIMLVVGLYLS